MEGRPPATVVGREAELAALRSFLDDVPAGPCGLVLEGAAGVGKTTLWWAAANAAREQGLRVLEARGVRAEASFGFTALGDLLGTAVDSVVDRLPPPQADALRVALLLERPQAVPPDDRAVAMAVLGALRGLVADRPVLVAVDDVQWLDQPSAAALAFAWRRLRDEPVGLLVGWRVGEREPDVIAADERVRRLAVEPLSMGAVHRVLQARLDLVLPRPTLVRLYEVAGGNAFHALELGRALQRRQQPPSPGEPLPVPQRLRDLMGERLGALPAITREMLAAIAALRTRGVAVPAPPRQSCVSWHAGSLPPTRSRTAIAAPLRPPAIASLPATPRGRVRSSPRCSTPRSSPGCGASS
ncbi:MAG: ATP-binding protein [Actinobacteria bacterium]|nr:ATP-binding protein [Actinomycetota bacterium]